MKRIHYLFTFLCTFILCLSIIPFKSINHLQAEQNKPMLAIIIDDFGGYEQGGVKTMLSVDAPITCAVMPNVDNTRLNVDMIINAGKEVIVHMPMQACVNLPHHWYGPEYISNFDTKEIVYKKLNNAFNNIPEAKGFNIHIGSGVCQYEDVVNSIYKYAIENNKYFLDSRTHINTICPKVAQKINTIYLGCDKFLEPEGNKSYNSVKNNLKIGSQLAKDNGFAIVIGHIGSHGGENTAKAIQDSISEIKSMGVEIVSLSTLYKQLQSKKIN